MKIEKDEITLNGGKAIAAIGAVIAVILLFQFFTDGNPEKNSELQASLREDIKRYLSSSNALAEIESAESRLTKNASTQQVRMIQESMESLFDPKIIAMDIEKSFLNTFCSDDSEYLVKVRYRAVDEQVVNLRYCLVNRKRWIRASSFRVL